MPLIGGRGFKSIQSFQPTLDFGGTGWRTAYANLPSSVVLANTRINPRMATAMRSASGRVTQSWYLFPYSPSQLAVRAYVETYANVPFDCGVEESSAALGIQYIQAIKFAGGSIGLRTDTVSVTPVPDYTKARVEVLNQGLYLAGENNPTAGFLDHAGARFTDNSTVTLGGYVGATDSTGFTFSLMIIP